MASFARASINIWTNELKPLTHISLAHWCVPNTYEFRSEAIYFLARTKRSSTFIRLMIKICPITIRLRIYYDVRMSYTDQRLVGACWVSLFTFFSFYENSKGIFIRKNQIELFKLIKNADLKRTIQDTKCNKLVEKVNRVSKRNYWILELRRKSIKLIKY